SVPPFTKKQGQYLAFIYNYWKIHGRAPAESDLQRYFQTTPPSVHQMTKTLELSGFIERTPGQARSIRLLVPPEPLPLLQQRRMNPLFRRFARRELLADLLLPTHH